MLDYLTVFYTRQSDSSTYIRSVGFVVQFRYINKEYFHNLLIYLILFQVRMNEDIHTCICHERSNKVIISEVLCNNEPNNNERIRSFVRTLRTFVRTYEGNN